MSFIDFHDITSDDTCLDLDERKQILDQEAVTIIKKICSVGKCTDVQNLEKDKRDKFLKALKDEGLSTRQLARLTGISRGIILKA